MHLPCMLIDIIVEKRFNSIALHTACLDIDVLMTLLIPRSTISAVLAVQLHRPSKRKASDWPKQVLHPLHIVDSVGPEDV